LLEASRRARIDEFACARPRLPREAREIDAFGEAEAHQQHFAPALGRRQRRALGLTGALPVHVGEPGLGQALLARREFRAREREPAMSARTDTDVVAVAPISKVVAALGARAGMVGDLVGEEPRIGE